jgi:DNA modification methylase
MIVHCAHDKLVPLSELKSHPKNRNKHPKDQIERLASILKYQGWRYPVKVSKRSGYVTSGHGRILAAKHNGWSDAPVNYQDYESEEQEYADVQADNAIAAWAELDLAEINVDLANLGRDFDIDLLGIKDFVVEPADNGGLCGDDEVSEPPKKAKSKRGELWLLGEHRLLIDDCTVKENVKRLMHRDGSAHTYDKSDMMFTSPPYLDLREYKGDLDLSIPHLSKIFDWPADIFCINLGLIIRDRKCVTYWNEWLEEAQDRDLQFLSWNVWDKGHASAPAHQQAMFGLCHEWIFVFGKYRELLRTVPNKCAGETHAGNATVREKDGSLSSKSRTKIQEFRQQDSVLRLAAINCRSSEYTGHPASFPIAFAESYITSIPKNSIISDPFLGSGSTLIACHKTNRRCFGMEIDPLYGDVILTRWATYTGKDPVREDGVPWSQIKERGLVD